MNPSPEEALFQLALAKPVEKRTAFLDATCDGNAALRHRLEALLAAHERPEAILVTQAEAARSTPELEFAREPSDEAVGQTLGRYKLLEKVGEGGCGVVYVAEQTEPVRRRVALKVIKLGMDTKQVVARFEAERQALAMMDHPNIAKILDAGMTGVDSRASVLDCGSPLPPSNPPEVPKAPEDWRGSKPGRGSEPLRLGRPFFVMELVRGIRITDYCDQNHLSTRERLDLFIKVCQAIQHAHQKGIIHRDIKPSNILVTLHDGVPVPKVIDFGIAKATEGRLTDATVYTQLHQFIGTPAYMSPEQAEMSGLDVDTRSDIYSLGVLLYELLAGSTPFDPKELMSGGIDAMRKTIREKEPPRPSTRLATLGADQLTTTAKRRSSDTAKLQHQLQGDLDWIVMKCLEKDRQRRYETANGLAADLKRHLANEPVVARPPSSGYRLQKAFRRNRLSFVAAGAVAAALMIGTGVSTWQMVEAGKARSAEREQRLTAQAAQRHAEIAQAAEKVARLRADTEKLAAQRHLYAANMNLAQQAWEQPNLFRLQHLLQETEASPFRGFEWFYWQRQTHLAALSLRGHLESVHSVAFSPDGLRLVTGSGDHTAKVWDAATGRELLTLEGHSGEIWSVAFFPDGRRIVTGGADQTARVWDATSGRELFILGGHSYRIYQVAISPDGQRIATPSGAQLKIWAASDGRELLTPNGHSTTIYSVAYSMDGQRLLTGSGDHTAKVWDSETGAPLLTLQVHGQTVRSVAFSPDGQRIVTASDDQTVRVWDAAIGRELHTFKGHKGLINTVDISPDGQQVATGSDDFTVKVWDPATGRDRQTITGHRSGISSVAFSPDGQRIAAGSFDGTASVWEVATERRGVPLKAHTAAISAWAISPDRRRVVTGSHDHTARVWEVADGRELLAFRLHTGPVTAVAFSPDGQRIVTGGHDQSVRLWEAATGRELLALTGLNASILAVGFSPDGHRMVAGVGNVARVWETSSGRDLLTLKEYGGEILSVAFSPDGDRVVAAGGGNSAAKVWDATSGRELVTLKGHTATIWSVAFSPDGQWMVTASGDETARLWETDSGREIQTLRGHNGRVKVAAFSPDGQRIVTGSSDQTVRIWATVSGWELLVLSGHEGGVDSVAFSPDGHRIITGSYDRTVRQWLAARPEQVTAWHEEEREASQRLAALERERSAQRERENHARASEAGALKRWRILAPIPLATGQTEAEGLATEQIPREAWLRPRADEIRSVAGIDLRWQDVTSNDYRLNIERHLGRQTLNSVAYAVCYLRSETEQVGLRMLVGSASAATVFLNGKRVHHCQRRRISTDQDTVPEIALHAGINAVVFKLITESNTSRGWWGSIRFTDAAGQPVQGIEAMLDPEAKN